MERRSATMGIEFGGDSKVGNDRQDGRRFKKKANAESGFIERNQGRTRSESTSPAVPSRQFCTHLVARREHVPVGERDLACAPVTRAVISHMRTPFFQGVSSVLTKLSRTFDEERERTAIERGGVNEDGIEEREWDRDVNGVMNEG
eukprot:6038568-Pleurochrysis_carterae.AAC.1